MLYRVVCVQDGKTGRMWWEVINNNSNTLVAEVGDHDTAHELARLLTETQTLLAKVRKHDTEAW